VATSRVWSIFRPFRGTGTWTLFPWVPGQGSSGTRILATSLATARALVPRGLTRREVSEDGDPMLAEQWG
jgi:hypothetical protein